MQEYPLSIRDVSPHPDAVRLTGLNPDGLPSGVHTGGAWLHDDKIYKPLDARPYANCPNHYETQELELLQLMLNKPLFPKNWDVEEINGRRFLVRRKGHLIPEDVPYGDQIGAKEALDIEQAIRSVNLAGWEIGDEICLAIEPLSYSVYLYDLSNAHPQKGAAAFAADDTDEIIRFFKRCGLDSLVTRRQAGRHALSMLQCTLLLSPDFNTDYRHVYASYYRPLGMWSSRLPKNAHLEHQSSNREKGIPHTWCFTYEPLAKDVVDSYELTWAWSPVH